MLGVVTLVTFGTQARRLGFYLDDWVMLERLLGARDWWAGVQSLAETNYAFRTLSLAIFPTLFALFGADPFGWQATLLVLDWALAFLLYLWLRGWLGAERPALAAAALAVMLPICPSAHHWITNLSQRVALPLCLASLILHRRWLEDRGPRRLAYALGAYATSLLLYESGTFLPGVQAVAYFVGLRQAGRAAREAARKTAFDVLVPFGAALAASATWRLLYPLVFGHHFPVSLSLRPGPFLRDYYHAAESWGPELVNLSYRASTMWRQVFGDGDKILWALFTTGCAWTVSLPSEEKPRREFIVVGAAITAAGFVFAYLPFALSGAYPPQVVGIMSRVNAAGVLFLATGLACILEAGVLLGDRRGWNLAGRFARTAALACLIGPFTWTNWYIARTWGEAYAMQQQIVSNVVRWLKAMPSIHTVVLQEAPSHYSGAEVFSAHWGFDAALRIRLGRKDVFGLVALPTMQTEARGLVDYASKPPRVTPYEGMLLYHYPTAQMRRPVPAK